MEIVSKSTAKNLGLNKYFTGKLVSGLHVETNLQYLPEFRNQSKGNRFEPTIEVLQA